MQTALNTRARRAAMAGGITALAAVVSFTAIWAAYGFRYRPTPAADVNLNLDALADRAASNAAFVRGEATDHPPRGPAVRMAMAAGRHGWLPQAYVAGFLFTYANNLVRPAVLLGHRSLVGWWYYFPLAMAFKTPVATLAAAVLTLGAVAGRRWWPDPASRWTAITLAVPFGLFLASAMSSHLNIGLRHVFPLYPLAFVAVGWAAAAGLRRWPRAGRFAVAGLALGLLAETAAAFPNYISFFNAPSAALGDGGFDLLGDSNLDWGQGLIALADWQRLHPREPLYLSYFGLADPLAYGIRFVPLPGGYRYDRSPRRLPDPARPCWVAVSITNLQGADLEDERLRPYYQRLAARRPVAVLGGSIYLYRYDPAEAVRESARGGGSRRTPTRTT